MADKSKKQRIIDEIRGKVDDYESNLSNFLDAFNLWADMFSVKPPTRGKSLHQFSNPRLTEMFRATNALATLEYRMLTSQDPFFETVPMELGAHREQLHALEATLQTQLFLSGYKKALLRALYSKILFGTVIVEEQYKIFGANPSGRRFPITSFEPRSMLNIAFDRHTFDIDNADWLSTSDVISNGKLMNLVNDNDVGAEWNKAEIEAAVKVDDQDNTMNSYVRNRLERAGYHRDNLRGVKELLMYHGKLDTLNDGVEYVVALINRKAMIRFHPNNFQHGRKPFRVAKWVDFELSPTGMGLGHLLSPLQRSMDANRQKTQDLITFSTYSPWLKSRFANINPNELKLRPMQIIETDDVNGMKPIIPDLNGADAGLKLEELLKSEFRAASGATETLQAIITEATASEVSLAQNEAVRNISVKAELAADELVRKHLEIMHSNNVQNINQPLNVNIKGNAEVVYPIDLQIDVDFKAKTTTDKDFKPQRIKTLVELLQIMTSIRNQNINFNPMPIAKELAGSLGINPSDIELTGAQAPSQVPIGPGVAPVTQAGEQAGTEGITQTPVGDILGSP